MVQKGQTGTMLIRPSYESALRDLEAQESALVGELTEVRGVIAGLRKLTGRSGDQQAVLLPQASRPAAIPLSRRTEPRTDAGTGPYSGMELVEAAFKFLSRTPSGATAREVAEALKAGGIKSRAEDMTATVAQMLKRDKAADMGIYKGAEGKWFVKPSAIREVSAR